ncbi:MULTISPECIES: hypothetical protein [unclassified Vibrio]|uniref:hypothetical protein n=1 Tax=unclassified Vibrio TaxID=2614977 RepID=UPI002F3EBBE3
MESICGEELLAKQTFPVVTTKIIHFLLFIQLLIAKIDAFTITLLLDDSQSEYITADLWQGDRATIQE